jgi:glycosyltransferase involved in cell wall biosynthesis
MPLFTVVIATRDRPALFAAALGSVLAQEGAAFEVVVVDDGSTEENRALYGPVLEAARARLGEGLRHRALPRRPRGHGQSYSLNTGVAEARGDFVCFLDDDDAWTDPDHLARAAAVIGAAGGADLYLANQHAFRGEAREPGPVWIEALAEEAARRGIAPDAQGAYRVGIAELMALTGFCHVNALTVRRALWEAVGGMEEGIRWECDRDLFLRLIDRAEVILHHPAVVSRHNIPDPKAGSSMTTSLANLDRWLYQVRVLDRASLFCRHPLIRAHARTHKGYALKRIAEELARAGEWRAAAFHAREALGAQPGFKWLGYTAYCALRAAVARGTPP